MIQTCPVCFRADDVRWSRLPEQMVIYVCADPHGGAGPHFWTAVAGSREPTEPATAGATADLLDPLLLCVREGDPFVEYGIVEYRLRADFPDVFHAHVAERGHSIFGDPGPTASSVRFAATLGRLADRGALLKTWGPATGAWRRNERVTYWATPSTPPIPQLTWAEFCESIDRSPEWTTADVEELNSARPRRSAQRQPMTTRGTVRTFTASPGRDRPNLAPTRDETPALPPDAEATVPMSPAGPRRGPLTRSGRRTTHRVDASPRTTQQAPGRTP